MKIYYFPKKSCSKTITLSIYPVMFRYILLFLTFLSPALLSAQNFTSDAERVLQLIKSRKFDDAQRIADQLLRRAANVDDASALTEIGIAFEDSGRYVEAEPFHERALQIWEKQRGKNHPDTVPALTDLAINYKEQGRYAEAEPLYQQALAVKGLNDFNRALLMNNLAFLYQEQYRYKEAEELYKKALDIHKARTRGKDDEYMASPLQNLSRLYYFSSRIPDVELPEKNRLLEEAQKLAERALKIDEEYDKDHPDTGASYNMLAAVYSDQKRFGAAEPLFKRALDIYKRAGMENHPRTAECEHDLATLYERQERYAEAEPLRNHSVYVYGISGAEAHLAQDWYKSRAALYKITNRPKEAVADLKTAMDLSLKVHKHASGDHVQQAQAFSQYYGIFERMVDWQYELGDLKEAYEAMERSRARTLLDIMKANGIDLLTGTSEGAAEKLRAAEAAASRDVKIAEKAEQPEALAVARKKQDDAMDAILSESQAYRPMELIAFDTVRSELVTEKTLALEYLVGNEKSYLLIYGLDTEPKLLPLELNETQAKLFGVDPGPLTAKKIETLLQNEKHDGVLQLIGKPPENVTTNGMPDTTTLNKLAVFWQVLVPDEQIRNKITDRKTFAKLLIFPDGTLARFPFEALVVEPDAEDPQYLLERGPATVYAPSASMYYNLKHRKTEASKPQVLTVGNPDYNLNRNATEADTPSGGRNTHRGVQVLNQILLTQLDETEKETKRIEESCKANGINVVRFNLDQSTEDNVRQNVDGKTIVHLACHGVVLEDSNYCGLELTISDPNNLKNDGHLELHEMFALALKSCELAMLSACVTNIGQQQHGEGTWSMGRGMLASGAKRVVTTNWSIDDTASALLVYFFIKGINESSIPDHAAELRQAKREICNDPEKPEWRHPYYWAPFMLIGPN